ncbi:hypothetical protein N1851_023600 [Merluccius polli]|uniref:SCAN box domain-containing protein n=1 Tax=Merluccius polli TaxID=89951 RepID=A0AA47NW51_MERPO|nr:hypothetical protein N1851_023600 [Merluccius polli]
MHKRRRWDCPPPPEDSTGRSRGRYSNRLGLSEEDHRRRFREGKLGPAERPFIFAQQIKDAATSWLQPGGSAGEGRMLQKIVMEQFVEGLPAATSDWVISVLDPGDPDPSTRVGDGARAGPAATPSTMDEETEERGSPSKTTLSGEHGRRSRAKRRKKEKSPEQQERADSPGPSCVSMKSDWSMDNPANFKDGSQSIKKRRVQQERADSPGPSCVSMKSDWSMDNPANFKDGSQSIKKRRVQQERADSPGPSCVSMKSDWSMDNPVNFKDGSQSVEKR